MIIAQPKEYIAQFVAHATKVEPFRDYSAIGLAKDGQLVAGVIYNHYSGTNCCMHVAAVEGRTWLNRRFLFACFDYPFNQLQCRVVVGLVPRKNKDARRFDEHLGFTYQGKIPHALPHDDLLIYTMLKEHCRWLRLDGAKRYALAA